MGTDGGDLQVNDATVTWAMCGFLFHSTLLMVFFPLRSLAAGLDAEISVSGWV